MPLLGYTSYLGADDPNLTAMTLETSANVAPVNYYGYEYTPSHESFGVSKMSNPETWDAQRAKSQSLTDYFLGAGENVESIGDVAYGAGMFLPRAAAWLGSTFIGGVGQLAEAVGSATIGQGYDYITGNENKWDNPSILGQYSNQLVDWGNSNFKIHRFNEGDVWEGTAWGQSDEGSGWKFAANALMEVGGMAAQFMLPQTYLAKGLSIAGNAAATAARLNTTSRLSKMLTGSAKFVDKNEFVFQHLQH